MATAKKTSLYEFTTKRTVRSFAHEGRALRGPTDAGALILEITEAADREHFYVLYVDTRGQLIGYELVAVGGLASVEVHPREVFRGAILAGAHSIVVAHNHPSGDPSPSEDDRLLTRRLYEVGQLVGIPVLDHVVVAHGGGVSSMADDLILLARKGV